MMHSFDGLANEISTLLKNRGNTGYRGYESENISQNNAESVTPCSAPLLPLEIEGLQSVQSRGYGKGESNQSLVGGVTPVTPVTRNFEQGPATEAGVIPASEWHAILAGLKERASPDWITPDRWEVLLHDAQRFLDRWSSTAHAMGWTALDLFGVHPTRPAVRFDVMGLLLLLQGSEVVTLTAESASIRRPSGAVLRFPRPAAGGVLLSEAAHV
jgi:hypothetical protein